MGNYCQCARPRFHKKPKKRHKRVPSVLDEVRQQRKLSLKILKLFDMNNMEEAKAQNTARETEMSFLEEAKQYINYSNKSFQDTYEVVEKIGYGTQAVVEEVMHRGTGDLKVAKRVKVQTIDDRMRVENEIIVLQEIDHPNILKVYQYFEEEDCTILITDYVKGGSLYDAVKEQDVIFTEENIASILHQIISGLSYLHSRNILHCDIKPENILYQEMEEKFFIKLIDFGIVRDLLNEDAIPLSGTPGFMSPQHQAGDPLTKSDLWAAGVVCYFLFTGGKHPFLDDQGYSKKLEFPELYFESVSNDAIELISTLLEDEPWKRPSIETIFQNKWLADAKQLFNDWAIENGDMSFQNLEDFAEKNKLLQAIALFMASKGEGEDYLARAIFEMADTNNDGTISYLELTDALKSSGRSEQQASTLSSRIFKVIDSNNNGVIDYSEFVAANYDLSELEQETRLKTCFDSLDKEGSGIIELEELVGFVYPKQQIGAEERKQLINLLPGGQIKENISFNDFKLMVENSFQEEESYKEKEIE